MGANENWIEEEQGIKWFCFRQTIPIPAYLLALAVGNIKSKDLSHRCKVWTEPEQLQAAAYEFEETEKFLAAAEEIAGPYRWGHYDIVVLPPSFPYGGMENPCLTFLSSSLLAGDRSLADVVVHEICHSWTGNLVTNRTWEHFWLNEGWTMFLERKITGKLRGEDYRHFHALLGLNDLRDSVKDLTERGIDTSLYPDLSQTHPDDAFSTIPYEKGHSLLFQLEKHINESYKSSHATGEGSDATNNEASEADTANTAYGESSGASRQKKPSLIVTITKEFAFDEFIVEYLDQFAGGVVDLGDFINYVSEWCREKGIKYSFDWEKWILSPGMPAKEIAPHYDVALHTLCNQKVDAILRGEGVARSELTAPQQVFILDALKGRIDLEKFKRLEAAWELEKANQVEIRQKYLLVAIKLGLHHERALEFAGMHGRMKYHRAIYQALAAYSPESKEKAVEFYGRRREWYHPIASKLIAKDLGI